MAKYHENITVLKLKKGWNPDDSTLYVREARCYTYEGLSTYWQAVDKTVKFCDTILLKKFEKSRNMEKFHWSSKEKQKK